MTFYGLFWSLLCQHTSETAFWGCRFDQLSQFLLTQDTAIKLLSDEAWFQQLIMVWGLPCTQQDSAEFTHAVLTWMSSRAIDMRWERRVVLDKEVSCVDCGSQHMPLFLQFTPALATQDSCPLASLIRHWHQVDGMRTALVEAAPIICLHIDRLFQDDAMTVQKSSCVVDLEHDVMIPVFCNQSASCESVGYVAIAAASHLGQDQAGHYQAILKLQPGVIKHTYPIRWLVTQDNEPPMPTWHVPDPLQCNITAVWLVRSDCLQLPVYCSADLSGPSELSQSSNTRQNLLDLLRETPTPDLPATG